MTDVERAAPAGTLKIRDVIEKQRAQLALALPSVLDADRFIRLVHTEIRATPKLAECSVTSLLGALFRMAALGLVPGPDLGQCWLLPFQDKKTGEVECSLILGYKGIVNLCHRGDTVRSIYAREVCERDDFDYEYGLEEYLRHRPAPSGHRGSAVAFYGVAKFRSGGHYFLVHHRDETEEHRARSKSPERGPWMTDYNAMGRKTVIRAMAPFLPLTAEALIAIEQDERVIRPEDNDEFIEVVEHG